MSEPEHQESDRTTAADRVPIGGEADNINRISLERRQSRTIAAPRKWRRAGLTDLVCPECRAKVPSIADGFWHLQTAHNQGKGVDLEQWGRDLRYELDEYIGLARGRKGYVDEREPMRIGAMGASVLAVIVILTVVGIIYASWH